MTSLLAPIFHHFRQPHSNLLQFYDHLHHVFTLSYIYWPLNHFCLQIISSYHISVHSTASHSLFLDFVLGHRAHTPHNVCYSFATCSIKAWTCLWSQQYTQYRDKFASTYIYECTCTYVCTYMLAVSMWYHTASHFCATVCLRHVLVVLTYVLSYPISARVLFTRDATAWCLCAWLQKSEVKIDVRVKYYIHLIIDF